MSINAAPEKKQNCLNQAFSATERAYLLFLAHIVGIRIFRILGFFGMDTSKIKNRTSEFLNQKKHTGATHKIRKTLLLSDIIHQKSYIKRTHEHSPQNTLKKPPFSPYTCSCITLPPTNKSCILRDCALAPDNTGDRKK